jgi:TPR repeat protein
MKRQTKLLVIGITSLLLLGAAATMAFRHVRVAKDSAGSTATDLTALTKTAEQGDAEAQFKLAGMYYQGKGVPRDYGQAVIWIRKAADQGFADAQVKLGFMYFAGKGVPQDDGQAVAWYRKAAEQGHADAQYILGFKYALGRGVPQDDNLAAIWLRKAAEQGHADAQFDLGWMYQEGKGVTRDYEAAYGWVARANAQGYNEQGYEGAAKKALDELEKKLTPEQIARVQKMLSKEAKPAPQTP